MNNIKEVINSTNITKSALIKELGISRGTLYNWINGTSTPTHKHLRRLLHFFPDATITIDGVNYTL